MGDSWTRRTTHGHLLYASEDRAGVESVDGYSCDQRPSVVLARESVLQCGGLRHYELRRGGQAASVLPGPNTCPPQAKAAPQRTRTEPTEAA